MEGRFTAFTEPLQVLPASSGEIVIIRALFTAEDS